MLIVLQRNISVFKIIATIFLISEAYYGAGKSEWQNINRRPNHEHIFMKSNFSGNFSSAKKKKLSRAPMTWGWWHKKLVLSVKLRDGVFQLKISRNERHEIRKTTSWDTKDHIQPALTCSKSAMETPEKYVKYVQSQ